MTLTLDFQGLIFDSHILGKEVNWHGMKEEWVGYNVGHTVGLLLGHSARKQIGQVIGQSETLTVSNLLAQEWAILSLI